MKYELTIDIARSPGDVYAYLADPLHLREWQEDVQEVRDATGDPLPAGATFTEVRTFLGKRLESTLEVTASDPGKEFSLRTVTGPIDVAVRHLLEPTAAGTRLTLLGEADPGRLFGLGGPLLRKAAERRARSDFERLKRRLETAS
jgi:carbon monoxide dehydrogenase subunit G